ncbi:MAG: hypothetical protein H0U46_10880 [Actinobacteria bacterium]|nr:hypothetical protein [Actinomycetota bacterium]
MSGYSELRDLGVRFVSPDGPMLIASAREPLFRASWTSTVELLAGELRHLEAEGIAIELDMEERMFRLDGLPRSDARARSDGVRLSFSSKWGPLRYETAEFTGRWGEPGWQQNVRAIALSMEALRAVDRYGVSKRGEQYRGWKALSTGTDPADSIATPEIARRFLARWGQGINDTVEAQLNRAIRATHPDTGGDSDEFRKVMRARELVA